jgi:hypothetical protein
LVKKHLQQIFAAGVFLNLISIIFNYIKIDLLHFVITDYSIAPFIWRFFVKNFYRLRYYLFAAIFILLFKLPVRDQTTEYLQRAFTDLRFGMFIHYGILTFTSAPWAAPNQDPGNFFPKYLNCNQWAEVFRL